jgi:predicted transcriptional regulator
MGTWRMLGNLERAVMERLWSASEPQTVRQVYRDLSSQRELAYNTVMTVLCRLTDKGLAVRSRDGRAHRYVAARSRDDLVAGLLVDALHQVDDSSSRAAALIHFVARVGVRDVSAMRRALAQLAAEPSTPSAGTGGEVTPTQLTAVSSP